LIFVKARLRDDANALELLESEDIALRELFTELMQRRGLSVQDRAEYGDIAKEIVHHVAVREVALVEVAHAVSPDPRVGEVASRIERGRKECRSHFHRVERMSRGVQGMNLRTGQAFDTEMEELIQVVGTEIEWDLDEAIPELRASLTRTHRDEELRSARQLRRHAPTDLDPGGARWRERAPMISRFLTVYDRLRDFPSASRPDR
jgi:hypothetical protein